MKSCFLCGQAASPLVLASCWDKRLQAYVEHYVCRACNTPTVLDRERKCDRCKERAAVVWFDREKVCGPCALKMNQALSGEQYAKSRFKATHNNSRASH